MFNNNARLDLTCPNEKCNHKFAARLGDLRKSRVTCPSCGVAFEAKDFDRGLRDLERELKRFGT